MSDLTWKKGPPPLDVPGSYHIAWNPTPEYRQVLHVQIENSTHIGISGPWGPLERYQIVTGASWHFGPIPSPPSGETE